jgi:hypothetical protein
MYVALYLPSLVGLMQSSAANISAVNEAPSVFQVLKTPEHDVTSVTSLGDAFRRLR